MLKTNYFIKNNKLNSTNDYKLCNNNNCRKLAVKTDYRGNN